VPHYRQGGDSAAAHRVVRSHYGGLLKFFECFGFPERGNKMMTALLPRVKTHRGSVVAFEQAHEKKESP
jgi:hypothetical protein